ncbi:hypothetical protein AB0H77_26375 [Streptomyces sp. NPDC050844]|uniref:hypothetical protein n=1 Tax=Streptomyces sp. NPDC050844 TaxID=3155790 RepID=UPI0033D06361
MRRIVARLGAVSAALVVLAACGGPQGSQGSQGSQHGGAPAGRLERLTATQEAKLDRAEELLIQRCMKRQNLTYWPDRLRTPDERKNVRLVLDDTRWARTYGYGGELHRRTQQERKKDPNSAYQRGLSEHGQQRWDRAFFGDEDSRSVSAPVPTGGRVSTSLDGCLAQGQDILYGGLPRWFRVSKVAENLTGLYADDLKRDRRFRDAVHKWSRCMRGEGHDYATPEKIRDRLPELNERLSPDRAHAAEVRLAVAEAQCARSSELGRTARELERKYRDKAIGTRYRADVDTYLRLQHRALTTADTVLADRG